MAERFPELLGKVGRKRCDEPHERFHRFAIDFVEPGYAVEEFHHERDGGIVFEPGNVIGNIADCLVEKGLECPVIGHPRNDVVSGREAVNAVVKPLDTHDARFLKIAALRIRPQKHQVGSETVCAE